MNPDHINLEALMVSMALILGEIMSNPVIIWKGQSKSMAEEFL
jgi:hypothetical protein